MEMNNNVIALHSYTIEQLEEYLFLLEHRRSPECFSRKPKQLTFKNTSLLVLNMIKKAITVEVMKYFYKTEKLEKAPSRQAFTKAREKISYSLFKDFFEKSCELAITGNGAREYKDYRLLGGDGTSFFVGELSIKSLRDYFGESTTAPGKAMCRLNADDRRSSA